MIFFESVDDVIEHENEGECDQCGKWLGCETNMEKHKKREHESRELKIESHRGTQASCAETLYMGTTSEEELEKKWSELRNKEDWDDECEMCERPIMLHIGPCEDSRIRDNEYIYRDNEYRNICREWRSFKQTMNLIIKKHEIDGDNNGENFENTNEEDDEIK